jgi:hypothetical protein
MTIAQLYILFLVIGALGLLSSLIFGEMHHDMDFHSDVHMDLGHDAGHADSPKLFSLRVIFSFLMAFAIGGGALYLSGKPIGPQIIVGLIAGCGTGIGVWALMKAIYGFQGNSNIDSDNFIGKNAFVSIGTTNTGLAQVKLDTQGGDQLFMAQEANSKKLEKNEVVKITGRIGNTLIVSKQ